MRFGEVKEGNIVYIKSSIGNEKKEMFAKVIKIYDGDVDRSFHGSPYYDKIMDYIEIGSETVKTINTDDRNCSTNKKNYEVYNANGYLESMNGKLKEIDNTRNKLIDKIINYQIKLLNIKKNY